MNNLLSAAKSDGIGAGFCFERCSNVVMQSSSGTFVSLCAFRIDGHATILDTAMSNTVHTTGSSGYGAGFLFRGCNNVTVLSSSGRYFLLCLLLSTESQHPPTQQGAISCLLLGAVRVPDYFWVVAIT